MQCERYLEWLNECLTELIKEWIKQWMNEWMDGYRNKLMVIGWLMNNNVWMIKSD